MGKPAWINLLPMAFVMIMTLWSLEIMIGPWLTGLMNGRLSFDLVAFIALFLLGLAFMLIVEAWKAVAPRLFAAEPPNRLPKRSVAFILTP